jgi:carbon-monoxide dehydrogenase small subunit
MMDGTRRGTKHKFSLTVNGQSVVVVAYPMERLLDVLREQLRLTGAKEGCGEGECGSCCVFMDGVLVNSCLVPVLQAENAAITTIEGLATDQQLHQLQQAFLDCGAAQCGICTPGMILSALHLLRKNPQPAMQEIREALSGNLCRCTGYMQIFEAILQASNLGSAS